MAEVLLIKTRQAWIDQAETAATAMEKIGSKNIRTFAHDDYEQFCKLVEAYIALGVPVSEELRRLARIAPVSEVLGIA